MNIFDVRGLDDQINGHWSTPDWVFYIETTGKAPCGGEGCKGEPGELAINFRSHHLGTVPIRLLTPKKIAALYRKLSAPRIGWIENVTETVTDLARLTNTKIPGINAPEKKGRKKSGRSSTRSTTQENP